MLGITIKKTDGTLWAATQITATKDDAGADCVSFLCSGVMRTFPMTDVAEIVARQPTATMPEPASDNGDAAPAEDAPAADAPPEAGATE